MNNDPTTKSPKSNNGEGLLRRGQQLLGIDKAVFYGILLRVWQLFAGVVSALLITQYFTRELQGYYYTFASLAAMQSFFELGLFLLALNISSHEWVKLSLDKNGVIQGDQQARSRLISFGRKLFRWYAIASFAFVCVVGPFGYWFFAHSENTLGIDWTQPWIVFVVLSGLLLWILPFNSMLEGCGQVTTVNKFRVFQAVFANLAVWSCILAGGNLWTAVGAVLMRLLCELYFFCVRYKKFFKPFFSKPEGDEINWQKEVLPLQYRHALSGIVSYFAFFIFVPVLFKFHGPVVAGQMGMTWTVMMAIQGAAMAWVQTKAPAMGGLVAENRIPELDQLFFRSTIRSVGALAIAALCVWSVIYGLNYYEWSIGQRLLGPTASALFLLGLVVNQIPKCMTTNVRAYKAEPFVAASVVTSIATGILVLTLGGCFGGVGAAIAYLITCCCVSLPCVGIVWIKFRRQWVLDHPPN